MAFPTLADMEKFLGAEEDAVTMPAAGGFALPMGSIAPWTGGTLYSVSGWDAIDVATKLGLKPDATRVARPKEDGTAWKWCYYVTAREQEANAVQKEINGFNTRKVFQIGTKFMNILMDDASRLKWEPDQSKWTTREPTIHDIELGTINRSLSGRMAYHLTFLPSAVDAAARLFGYIERPIVNFTDLLDTKEPQQSDKLTEQYFSGKNGDWSESSCYKNRALLWQTLGCDDPNVSTFIGLPEGPLSNCLKLVTRPWQALWAEVGEIADPRISEKTYKNRFQVVCRLFADEAAAVAYLANRGSGNGVEEATGMPALPTTWSNDGLTLDDWLSFLGEKYTMLKGLQGTKRIAAIKTAFKGVEVDTDAWLAYAEAHNM